MTAVHFCTHKSVRFPTFLGEILTRNVRSRAEQLIAVCYLRRNQYCEIAKGGWEGEGKGEREERENRQNWNVGVLKRRKEGRGEGDGIYIS